MRLKQEHALAPLIHKSYSVKKSVIYSGSQHKKIYLMKSGKVKPN